MPSTRVNAAASTEARRLVRGTKGAHIAVKLPDACRGFGIATIHRGGDPFYCLPWRDDLFYFGPTETPVDGPAREVFATDEDIDFLLAEANHLLPGLRLTRRDVEFTWAGVRPLTFDPQQPMGRRTREIHDLKSMGMPGVFAMTAGPVMTHLSAGREMLQVAARHLGGEVRGVSGTGTRVRGAPAPGPHAQSGGFVAEKEPGRVAFRRAVADERARDLEGILRTRTGLAWTRHLTPAEVAQTADAVRDLLGWSAEQAAAEVERFVRRQEYEFRKPGAAAVAASPITCQ